MTADSDGDTPDVTMDMSTDTRATDHTGDTFSIGSGPNSTHDLNIKFEFRVHSTQFAAPKIHLQLLTTILDAFPNTKFIPNNLPNDSLILNTASPETLLNRFNYPHFN